MDVLCWSFLKTMALKCWHRLTQADNIYQSIRPLVYISLIGLAPFRMHSSREVQTSAPGLFVSFGHFLFYALCLGLSLNEGDTIIGYFFKTTITELSDITLMMAGVIAMLSIFGFAIFKRHRLIQIIQKNIIVDEIFVGLGLKLDYRKILCFSFVISVVMMTFNLGYLIISYFLLKSACIKPSFVVFTTFALPHINTTIMVFKFMCTTYLVKSRFSMLNNILKDMLKNETEQNNRTELLPIHSVHSDNGADRRRKTPSKRYTMDSLILRNPCQSLKEVTNIHNLLCDICIIIEEYFTYPLVAIVGISFMFILFDDYYILEVMLNPNRLEYFEAHEFFAFFLIQMLWYVIIILAIVEGSSSTIKESRKSAALVSKLLNATENLELRERLVRLSMQLAHRKVCFTGAGLFNLDRTLIFTISGTATCYLIILIQFRSTTVFHEDSKKGGNCSANYI
ncbi:putative gustatory receptor 28a [Eupeodes corollae]|uniref:putative gustatory receptor 28a n=1 Tax=Eupeodes corollae TaxID=290404 RepID=UPI00248FFB25|nr:putative gustatory receptor 28a [Eupeodes corollae]